MVYFSLAFRLQWLSLWKGKNIHSSEQPFCQCSLNPYYAQGWVSETKQEAARECEISSGLLVQELDSQRRLRVDSKRKYCKT